MKKVIITLVSIILGIIIIIAVCSLILKSVNKNSIETNNNEVENGNIDFDIINVDLEKIDLNDYSIKDCEKIIKNVIDKYNKNEYAQYNNSIIQSKINRLKELVEVKKYYEEVAKCVNHIKKNATFEEQKELYYKTDEDIILTLCDTKKNWSLLKISNELYDKMKKSNGILENNKITSYYVDNEPPYKVQRVKLIYENETQKTELIVAKETDYVYADENSYGSEIISNFVIEDTINLTDNLGNVIDTRKVFINESIKRNFEELCKDGDERSEMGYPDGEHYGYYGDDVAVSNNFRKKYPYFLDLFIHYSPLEYNKITLKDLDVKSQIAIFEVDSILECKRRTYEVKYMLDDKMYLDDVEVNILKEEEADLGKPEKQSAYYIFKNSKIDKITIPISENFIKKYRERNGIFNVDVKKFEIDYLKISGKTIYLYKLILADDSVLYLGCIDILDGDNNIDDFMIIELPYDSSLTLEEVKDAFLVDKELQKELGIEILE